MSPERIGAVVMTRWRVPCLMHCICGAYVEFAATGTEPPHERFCRRRCPACALVNRMRKKTAKRSERRALIRVAAKKGFERGRLSVQREHEAQKRRAVRDAERWRQRKQKAAYAAIVADARARRDQTTTPKEPKA